LNNGAPSPSLTAPEHSTHCARASPGRSLVRTETVDELNRLTEFLTTADRAWKSNNPQSVARGGSSILTYDRQTGLPDDDFQEFMWHIDIKPHSL